MHANHRYMYLVAYEMCYVFEEAQGWTHIMDALIKLTLIPALARWFFDKIINDLTGKSEKNRILLERLTQQNSVFPLFPKMLELGSIYVRETKITNNEENYKLV